MQLNKVHTFNNYQLSLWKVLLAPLHKITLYDTHEERYKSGEEKVFL